MKISKLIKQLKELKTTGGDLDVYIASISSDEDLAPLCGIITMLESDDTPSYFLLGDDETLLATE